MDGTNQISNTRAHILNATYIWYSSIASTNCPQESKSVPFLKLACHFCMVLLTSDMLAGRILAALSGQHSRAGDSSTGLQLWRRWCFGQHGYVVSRLAVTHRPSPSCLLTLMLHPRQKGSPACSPRCARFGARCRTIGGSNRMLVTVIY